MLRRLVAASFATSFSVLAACSGGDPIVPVDSNPNSNDTFTYAENTAWTDADVAREVTVEGVLEDYGCVAHGLLALFQATEIGRAHV